jgi:hypothetical protein
LIKDLGPKTLLLLIAWNLRNLRIIRASTADT